MKSAILAALVASAAAFVPTKQGQASSSLNVISSPYEDEFGVISPTGFWDPLKLSYKIDQETFDSYRLAELKHGRVAQLAILGYLVQEISRFPGELAFGVKFADIPNGAAALSAVPLAGWVQIFLAVGLVEANGTLGSFPQGQLNLPEEVLERRMLCELQHGRIAMIGFAELLRHDLFDGGDKLLQGLPFLY